VSRIKAVVSDFGGVLTSPLVESFIAFQQAEGVPVEAFGHALAAITGRQGANPLFELETGRISEQTFLTDLSEQLSADLGRPVRLHDFAATYLDALRPNETMIAYMRALRERGHRMAICTNNIREWERAWQAKFPVDEIFEVVVDSSAVGTRKPERRIYEITLEQLDMAPEHTLFIDDLEINCDAARELGMAAVWFRDTDQAIREIESVLDA
jgi:putative hydrolase of the HAD superfamily